MKRNSNKMTSDTFGFFRGEDVGLTEVFVRGIRLPYQKFSRNPRG